MFKEAITEIVHEENAKPFHDVKELIFRIMERLGELLDDNDPFVGNASEPEETEDENG